MLAPAAGAETVEIPGPAGPLRAEMIAVPGATDAVVIIPGSGPIDRDGNAPDVGIHSDTYARLAEGLAAAGVASLRIDKRGFFGSAGAIDDPEDVTIEAYAQDARDWVVRAAELAPRVWIAGHSEGGLVALVAAEDPPAPLAGLLLLSTAGRPVGRVLIEQMGSIPANAALMPDVEATVAALESGRMRDPGAMAPPLRPMFTTSLQRYMIDLFAYDPVKIAAGWSGPVLIVQGDADMQVKPRDAELLAQALPGSERVPLPGGTHMLKRDVPGAPFVTYTDPNAPLHPALIPAITDFLRNAAR